MGGMVLGVGDGWLVMVGGVDGIWLVEVTVMSHYFFSSYFLSYAATTFKTFSALFFLYIYIWMKIWL